MRTYGGKIEFEFLVIKIQIFSRHVYSNKIITLVRFFKFQFTTKFNSVWTCYEILEYTVAFQLIYWTHYVV